MKKILLMITILIIMMIVCPKGIYAWPGESAPRPEPGRTGGGGGGGGHHHDDGIVYVNNYIGVKGHIYDMGTQGNGPVGGTGLALVLKGVSQQAAGTYYGVGGVKVEVKKADKKGNYKLKTEMVTKKSDDPLADGAYEFTGSGKYKFDFTIGQTDTVGNGVTVEDVLTYNGHDYYVNTIAVEDGYLSKDTIIETEILDGREGVAQVYLLFDVSESMLYEREGLPGGARNKLEVCTNSAKYLINELLDGNNSIYVGLIAFRGGGSVEVSLTQNKEELFQGLEKILARVAEYEAGEAVMDFNGGGTNVSKAVVLAEESFYTNKEEDPIGYRDYCNRNIILIGDGVPTRDLHEHHKPYSDLSEAETIEMMKVIASDTREVIVDAVKEGIHMFSLLCVEDNEVVYEGGTEKDFIEQFIYYNELETGKYELVTDDAKVVEIIKEKIKKWILDQIQEIEDHEYQEHIVNGCEDPIRNAYVKSKFSLFFNNVPENVPEDEKHLSYHSTIFREIHNATTNVTQDAKKLGDETYMLVHTGPYRLFPKREGQSYVVGGITYIYRDLYYEDQNIYLQRRQQFLLIPEVTATRLRVTLNTGEVLFDKSVEEFGSREILLGVLDNIIAQGAEIEIEYEVRIKNEGSIKCTYLDLIDYLPKGFVYDENARLISNPSRKNLDEHWTVVDMNKLIQKGYLEVPNKNSSDAEEKERYKKFYDRYVGTTALRLTRYNNRKGKTDGYKDEFLLDRNNAYTAKFVISRIIGTVDDLPEIYNDVEIIGYGNTANRRMTREVNNKAVISENKIEGDTPLTEITLDSKLSGRYPGTFWGEDFAETSNVVAVIPPTGEDKQVLSRKEIIAISAGLTSLLIITGYILKKQIPKLMRKKN